MRKDDGWALGTNWIAIVLFSLPLISVAFILQAQKYERLMNERNALMAEMSPAQIRRAKGYTPTYKEDTRSKQETNNQN